MLGGRTGPELMSFDPPTAGQSMLYVAAMQNFKALSAESGTDGTLTAGGGNAMPPLVSRCRAAVRYCHSAQSGQKEDALARCTTACEPASFSLTGH